MEEHFKNKLKNHKVDWNKEELLGNLKQELGHNDKSFDRRWFILLFVLLMGTYCLWNKSFDTSEKLMNSSYADNYIELNKSDVNRVEKKEKIQVEYNENKLAVINSSRKPVTSTLGVNESITSNKLSDPNYKAEKELNQGSTKVSHDIKPGYIEKSANAIIKAYIPDNTILSEARKTDPKKLNINSAITSDTKIPIPSETIEGMQRIQETSNKLVYKSNENGMHISIPPLQNKLELKGLHRSKDHLQLPLMFSIGDNEEIQPVAISNPFYISVSGDIGFIQRSRSFTSSNLEFVNRLKNNEETESSLLAVNTNVNFGYQHSSGLSVQSGLEYSEYREVFNYTKETSESFEIPKDDILYFIVDGMDTTFVLDTSILIKTEKRRVRNFNKSSFVTIPLKIGFQFNLNRTRLVGRFGISYTLKHNFEGRTNIIFEEGGNEVAYNNPENDFVLKNRIGLQLGIEMVYPFRGLGDFFVMATYRRNPKLTRYVAEQNYNSISLGAGIKFPLGKID